MEYIFGLVLAAIGLLLIPQPFGLILVLGLLIGAVLRLSERVPPRRSSTQDDIEAPVSAREQVQSQMARYEQEWRERHDSEER